ncbi:DUF1330 domain-containing protein [Oceaniovalibus sp. ACAM 378]|uniref:DUF1330 domain-containing protein n=1 Tax=Oceaniovalibus sp. ACAM 378 TaxID=2599923 RepID=UPI0011D76117|nr:DUF1330 domain-containing protein [Oceaniovalibus sp. ACAM 378]TYB91024.1 DUF1330 domain-containing protein [Oceaniovalibus sp. ACAM 378]
MPKGYWIANNIVHDLETYEQYKAANAAVFARYGARFIVRGGQQQVVEGECFPRCVVIEFDSYADAVACYESDEYTDALAIRAPISEGRLIIVEGYEG